MVFNFWTFVFCVVCDRFSCASLVSGGVIYFGFVVLGGCLLVGFV